MAMVNVSTAAESDLPTHVQCGRKYILAECYICYWLNAVSKINELGTKGGGLRVMEPAGGK